MIILSNDCSHSYFYKLNNVQYNHPLFWTLFLHDDYISFVKNYDNINWLNYNIYLDKPINKTSYECKGHYYMNIDNKFNCEFPHYTDESIGLGEYLYDAMVPDAKKYIEYKYLSRLKRFNKKDKTIFLYNQKKDDTINDVLEFINLDIPYQKIVYTNFKLLTIYNSSKVKVIYSNDIDFIKSSISFAMELKHYF